MPTEKHVSIILLTKYFDEWFHNLLFFKSQFVRYRTVGSSILHVGVVELNLFMILYADFNNVNSSRYYYSVCVCPAVERATPPNERVLCVM